MLVLAGCLLAPGAAEAATFDWSGQATSATWSTPANWLGRSAPSGTVDTLRFPALTSPACTVSPPSATCHQSANDENGLTTSGIVIDDGAGYDISGNPVTLGSGGITASPSPGDPPAPHDRSSTLNLPIILAGPQTWSISGGSPNQQLLVLGNVAGVFAGLTLQLSSGAGLTLADAEVGPVNLVGGSGSASGAVKLGYLDNTGTPVAGSLNANDGNPVTVTGGAEVLSLDGTIGPLTATGGSISVGRPDHAGTLTVEGSVGLDAQSTLSMSINGSGTAVGTDYSELSTNGTVDLGGATLALEAGVDSSSALCTQLAPGTVVTLVYALGGLTGQFTGIPDGKTVQLGCPDSVSTPPTATINYTANAVTATIATPGSLPSTTTLSADPSSAVTNQPVTLTATVSVNAGAPRGTVQFSRGTTPIAGCEALPVTISDAGGTATCQTSFAASPAPNVSAAFSPDAGSGLAGSTTSDLTLSVGPAATATAVALAPAKIGSAQSTAITATVTTSQTGSTNPSGTVAFLLDGKPPPGGAGATGCTSVPIVAGSSSSTARCDLRFEKLNGTSTHAISATYGGDANFTASTSAAQALTTVGKASKVCRAHAGHASVSVIKIDVVVTCKGSKGQRATVSLELSTREKTKDKAGARTVVAGKKTLSLRAGQGETVHVALDAAAIRTLVRARKLSVTLTVTQKASTGTARLRAQRLTFRSHCRSTWAKLKICHAR